MKRGYRWLVIFLLMTIGHWVSGQVVQQIASKNAIVLPAGISTTFTVNTGEKYEIISETSITLKDGVTLKQGSDVLLKIAPVISGGAGDNAGDPGMNWTLSRSFDASGRIIGESKRFFDFSGQLLQIQEKNFTRNEVLASEPVRDGAGRIVGQSLSAPVNGAKLLYKNNFILNSAGTPYTFANFDRYTSGVNTVDKSHNPDAVGGKNIPGTLGWYYSDNNTAEKYQATTDFPYSRTLYAEDGTGRAVKQASMGDSFRTGTGKERYTYVVPVNNELVHYFQLRNKFFAASSMV